MFIILFLFPLLALAKDEIESRSSVVHFMQNFSNVTSMLESLPKECTKNGKKYKEGEEFQIGHLRYKCQKYGVYSIEGCVTEKKKNLNLGEVVVIDNVKSQCLGKGNSVFYRETVCGIMGQPECDKIDLPTGFKEAAEREQAKPKQTEINVPGLPKGWKVLDESRQEVPGTNGGHIISRTLMFQPILQGNSRARRQTGHGVGSVIGIEDVGTEKPPMPMSMLLNGGKASNSGKPKQSGASVQSVSSTLNVKGNSKERVAGVGTGSGDLHSRTPTASNTKGFKPESVSGSRSHVDWKGKTISVNGRTVAAGPGTFSFGSSPTGAFVKKDN